MFPLAPQGVTYRRERDPRAREAAGARRSDAAAELLRRRKAREGLLPFAQYVNNKFMPEAFHIMLASVLEDLVTGTGLRYIISAPPQAGKSMLCSQLFPAFYMAHNPENPIILSSYAADLAQRHSGFARDVVVSPEYQQLFPEIKIRQDSRAKDLWSLTGHRSEYRAVGVGGPITGHGALLGIIDDPFENWEQARSEAIREKVYMWWLTTFRSRIWAGGNILVVMTRWNEDDLVGRMIEKMTEPWRVFRFPALAETQEERDEINTAMGLASGLPDILDREPGESLAPIRMPKEELETTRAVAGPIVWPALYQGFPRMPEGRIFTRAMFPVVPLPAGTNVLRRVRYWDKAATEGSGCYSVGIRVAMYRTGPLLTDVKYHIEDIQRGQWGPERRNEIMKQTALNDPIDTVQWVEQEPGSGGKESADISIKMFAEIGRVCEADRVTGSKDTRLVPAHADASRGAVTLEPDTPDNPWNKPFVDEMIAVPTGKYRDQADGYSGALSKVRVGYEDSPAVGDPRPPTAGDVLSGAVPMQRVGGFAAVPSSS